MRQCEHGWATDPHGRPPCPWCRIAELEAKVAAARNGAQTILNQQQRIAELEARLELTACDGTRLDIGDCDGIACRDETIRLLEAELAKVRAERDSLKSQLGINASLDARLTDNVAEHWRRENERLRAKLATLSRPPDHDDNMRRFVTGCPKCDPPRPTAPEGEPVYGFPAESPLDDERRRTGFFPAYHSPPDCLETEPQEPEPQEPEPEGYLRGITAEKLVERAVRNARPRTPGPEIRWGVISQAFALGSTYSMELCRKVGVDPHEMVAGPVCEACETERQEAEGRQSEGEGR